MELGRPEAGYLSVLLSYLPLAESRVEKKAIWSKRATDSTRETQAALRNIFHIAGKTRGPRQGRHSSARDIPGSIVLTSLEGVPQQRQKSTDSIPVAPGSRIKGLWLDFCGNSNQVWLWPGRMQGIEAKLWDEQRKEFVTLTQSRGTGAACCSCSRSTVSHGQ